MHLYQAYVVQLSTGKLTHAREEESKCDNILSFFSQMDTPTFFLLVSILTTEDGYILKVFMNILEAPATQRKLSD